MKYTLQEVARDIEHGDSLADALSHHPRVFNDLYVNMVRAAEMGGALDQMLDRIASTLERNRELAGKIKMAMFYPLTVLSVALTVTLLIVFFVVPRISDVYDQLSAELPLPTRILVSLSHILRNQWWLGLAFIATAVVVWKILRKWEPSRYLTDLAFLKMPVMGKTFTRSCCARFASTLATLIKSGVPILQSLELVRGVVGNRVFYRAIGKIHQNLKDGGTISEPLKENPIFPAVLSHMISVGEETGNLDEMLEKVAENFERQVDIFVRGLSSVLEPIMIVFLGIMIGGIVIALYLPLFNMINVLK